MVPKINSQREDKSKENKSNVNKDTAPHVSTLQLQPNQIDSINSKEDKVDLNNGLMSNIEVTVCQDQGN